MNPRIRSRWTSVVAAIVLVGFAAGEASAIIGRPLTPMSYAGVARRTARHSAYAGTAMGPYYPTGCTTVVSAGVAYRSCGGTMYRPYYNGATVVYHVE
jgi:hypothetical protein